MSRRPLATVDPRHWNLVVGTTLAIGCGPQPITSDDGHSTTEPTTDPTTDPSTDDTTTDTTLTITTTTTDDDPPECENDNDCNFGYECIDGICEYYGYADGNIWYECYSDLDCPPFYFCDLDGGGGFCIQAGQPPPTCAGAPPIPRQLDPGAPVLGLTFVDLDADGRDELAVATQAEFLIYTPDSDVPTVVPRALPSNDGELAGGAFDLDPGEDLIMAVNELGQGLVLYSADGMGGLVQPPTPIPEADGLMTTAMVAGDIDGQAGEDVLVVGPLGASLVLGASTTLPLTPAESRWPNLLDRSHAITGMAVAHELTYERFDLGGGSLGVIERRVDSLAVVALGPDARVLAVRDMLSGWGWIFSSELLSGIETEQAVVPHTDLQDFSAADLDGDQFDEVLIRYADHDAALWLEGPPFGCLLELGLDVQGEHAGSVAVGDHDGDGDEELAMHFGDVVLLVDHE